MQTTSAAKLLIIALALVYPGAALAAPRAPAQPVVKLRATATVQEATVRLADVAVITGGGSLAAKAARIDLGTAPLPGKSRAVSADDIRIRLRRDGLNPDLLASGSIRRCMVTRASQTVTADALLDAARTFVTEHEADGAGHLFIEPISKPRDLALPVGQLALSTRALGQAVGSTRRVTVLANVDGKACGRADVSFRARRMVRVAVAAATIQKDQTLSGETVRYEERDRAMLPNDALLEGDALDGLEALRTIAAGVPITRRMADVPAIIRRGETVNALVRTGGIEVGTPVVAMEDGRPDGWLRVRNTQSNREFRALVVDAKTVEAPL